MTRFTNPEDYEHVLTQGPWMLGDNYVLIREWAPNFISKEDSITTAWICIPRLGVEYFNKYFLMEKIGKKIVKGHKDEACPSKQGKTNNKGQQEVEGVANHDNKSKEEATYSSWMLVKRPARRRSSRAAMSMGRGNTTMTPARPNKQTPRAALSGETGPNTLEPQPTAERTSLEVRGSRFNVLCNLDPNIVDWEEALPNGETRDDNTLISNANKENHPSRGACVRTLTQNPSPVASQQPQNDHERTWRNISRGLELRSPQNAINKTIMCEEAMGYAQNSIPRMGRSAVRRPPDPLEEPGLEQASLAIRTRGHFGENVPDEMGLGSVEVDVGDNHMNPNAQETVNLVSVSDATQHF
ncbi:hypothetical protein Cgig2_001135 [Carnegiea gigantea]|uniref:DUF4283 domain-containing protein n=1 Tax=Carnegiea gigantea TaxID=171969 RepID=A0A9Q1GPH3_9CARY|nr:hypothetical protein Cgig2_001135 [Carnegiea gigantea]